MRALLLLLIALILVGCPDDPNGPRYNFLKAPNNFKIELYSDTTNPRIYVMSWENPIEERDFVASQIILDTTNWKVVEKNFDAAEGPSLSVPYTGKKKDSILFSLVAQSDNGADLKDSINHLAYYHIDSTGNLDSLERKFVFALISNYHDSDNGKPKFTPLIAFDTWAPNPVKPNLTITDRVLDVNWIRPKDFTSIFYPLRDSGEILGYHIILEDAGKIDSGHIPLDPDSIKFIINGDTTLIPRDKFGDPPTGVGIKISDTQYFSDIDSSDKKFTVYELFIPDGNSVHPDLDSNRIQIIYFGLVPENTYKFQAFAEDTSGNKRDRSGESITLKMTDVSKPDSTNARLTSAELQTNQINIDWDISQDTRENDSLPNQNILGYHIRRISYVDTGRTIPFDTLEIFYRTDPEEIKPLLQDLSELKLTGETGNQYYTSRFLFLPPNTAYKFEIWALDSSNHSSDTSVILTKTAPIDSTISCPEGFVPIPKKDSVGSFCIQTHENLDSSTNTFSTNVDRVTAQNTCENISPGNTYLCTESQWVRACEGGDSTFPLQYGIQSITLDTVDVTRKALSQPASILQTKCNQAAGDEEMAQNINLRNTICITDEGVYDLAGNLSEWVASDTDSSKLIFKGGNYLKPNESITQIQAKAQCSHLGQPRQKRPNYVDAPDCLSDKIGLTATFKLKDNKDSISCKVFDSDVSRFTVPPDDDSTVVMVYLVSGDSVKHSVGTKEDTLIKPYKIERFEKLLEVELRSKIDSSKTYLDTLEFTEIANSGKKLNFDGSPSDHEALTRETNVDIWDVIPLREFYAHVLITNPNKFYSKKAKPYYSNKVIGFRCCSSPLNN